MNYSTRKLIRKLNNGDCDKGEIEILFSVVKTLPKEEAFMVMEELWKQYDRYPKSVQKRSSKMYAAVISQIAGTEKGVAAESAKEVPIWRKRTRFSQVSSVAAVLLLVILSIWFWADADRFIILKTAYGEQQTFRLPDESIVKLNANSTIRFEDNWDVDEERKIWLEGEAFFEVKKQPVTRQKFQVITADLTVEVLGTTFNVNSHHGQTKVYLEEGSIALQLKHFPKQERLMQPGELVNYSASSKEIITQDKKASQSFPASWKNGVLMFENTPLGEVLLKIEEIYGMRFEVKDESNFKRNITTGLPIGKLEIVLPMLEQAMGLKIEKEEDHMIIR